MAEIRAQNLVVEFPIYGSQSRSIKKALMRAATGGAIARDANERIVVRALDHVSLECKRGDRIGLIGHNGSGKSTLLRVLAGAYEPIGGSLTVTGRVASMLSITLGMDFESTGYENIRLLGLLFGMGKEQVASKINRIAEFTELGDYLSMPLRTYSSGMAMRIAFAVATSIEPEIILMDEWIGVGDAHFMDKANARLEEFVNRAGLLVLATHSHELLSKVCNKAVLLEHGRVIYVGSVPDTIGYYQSRSEGYGR